MTTLAPLPRHLLPALCLLLAACSPAPPRYDYSKNLAQAQTARDGMSEADRALFDRARQYEYGNGVQADPYKARDLYQQLADRGVLRAQQALGDLYLWRFEDTMRAIHWYKQAADAGDCLSAADLVFVYRHGLPLGGDRVVPEAYARTGSCPEGEALVFGLEMKYEIDAQKIYPTAALHDKRVGISVVEFDYTGGGRASNVKINRSSGDTDLDAAAVKSVASAQLPERPAGIPLGTHFIVGINYHFN